MFFLCYLWLFGQPLIALMQYLSKVMHFISIFIIIFIAVYAVSKEQKQLLELGMK